MNNVASTGPSKKIAKKKIPLWIFVVFFTTVLVALSSVGISQYQQQQEKLSQVQQTKVEELKQSILQQQDVISTNWLHTLNPLVKDVTGSIIWSSQEQQGIVEFSKLPILKKSQRYHLWIYDLNMKSSAPVSALVFQSTSQKLTLPFKVEKIVSAPFKFELMLEVDGVAGGLSLLLAQP
jgi:hypothetical protein